MSESELKLTPMMLQYKAVKEEVPADAILLFRMGDFYEMFFEDAVRGSSIMDIALTKRQGIPMCGVPHHALDNYLPKLIESGIKVAIADQLEDPKLAKGIVKRGISRIITPGTVVDSSALPPNKSNFLVSVAFHSKNYGIASLELSTGLFQATEIKSLSKLSEELSRLNAKEIIVSESFLKHSEETSLKSIIGGKVCWTTLDDWHFKYDAANDFLKKKFDIASLDGFGCGDYPAAVCAAGAALYYAAENLRQKANHITSLKIYNTDEFMIIDSATRRNLEVVEPLRGTSKESTLLYVLDETRTSMGGRLLREWLLRPLYDREKINLRMNAIDDFRYDQLTLAELQEIFAMIRDLERIIGRLNIGNGNARDLIALKTSLDLLPDIKNLLGLYNSELIVYQNSIVSTFENITSLINTSILDEPPLTLTDGGIIRDGYNENLDLLRKASREGKNWIAELQTKEQERTGIKSLKIKYNRIFGYYIEITKSNLESVPDDYMRKQTLVNAERFITPELKEVESKVIGADDKAKALEYEIFQKIREYCIQYTSKIMETASSLAVLDVLMGLAYVASRNSYKRPHINDGDSIKITGGRHPVIERMLSDERFVPNDTFINSSDNKINIITGPNMAGKSTYIRQVALLVLMAQIGSFIPVDDAEIGLVDRIFTRVGASDDLSRGQSTFMVEMVETANILNNATDKSLIILDEIGRGTSTFDGLSIAWAVAEYIHNTPGSSAKTLFATHYHELTELVMTCKGVKNYNVAVKEHEEQVIFLRQIVPGAADKSYGIYVAKLAGLPKKVIKRSKEILENLERNAINEGQPVLAKHVIGPKRRKAVIDPHQLSFYDELI